MMGQMTGLPEEKLGQDVELNEALKNFRASVHAWSDAELSRERQPGRPVQLMSWRVAVGWALGLVLVAGSVGGGVYERQHQRAVAQAAALAAARQQAQLKEQLAAMEDEDLLAKVNSDIARKAPSAMEPLAQLMDEDQAQ